ncbi:hypothetical protein BO70DRAFT_361381 [Aspergillus heteromorphus CBS 117.55]|uniref:Uncharacterized protein n=1 Tax=Aspergillus heteromorphus CBS 117.55 TaxID=1448321 RepID=A0A317WL96_9EURO|nr:uncharacterized protein BO70DRAFT_361381 [Aspergillus heteromorphus CBS 117.55]PWY84990.1 hypothetical protein BO70DRAFT_361381 [Aspergillus heteromorphus CBS 117.55]
MRCAGVLILIGRVMSDGWLGQTDRFIKIESDAHLSTIDLSDEGDDRWELGLSGLGWILYRMIALPRLWLRLTDGSGSWFG